MHGKLLSENDCSKFCWKCWLHASQHKYIWHSFLFHFRVIVSGIDFFIRGLECALSLISLHRQINHEWDIQALSRNMWIYRSLRLYAEVKRKIQLNRLAEKVPSKSIITLHKYTKYWLFNTNKKRNWNPNLICIYEIVSMM